MALQFNPPSWLIQDYYNRKRPVDNLADTLRQISRDVLEQRQANRRDRLADQEMANRQEANRIAAEQVRQKGLDQFTESANPAFLPSDIRAGYGQPIQGPVTESGQAPTKDLVTLWAEKFAAENEGGYKGIASRKTQAETEKDLAMAEYYRGKPSGSPKTLDALLAERVQNGDLTLEEAIALKSKGSSPSPTKPPPGYRFRQDGSLEPIPGGPVDVKADKEDTKVKATLELYETARDGLLSGLGGSVTGPVAGRMPAVTSAQQVAEGGVSAMAPVLKQLFRVSGEGVFTDRDQEILIKMIPTRTDNPDARKAKIENIDAIVKAKLGMGGKSPAPAITSKAEYDALPSGSTYSWNGKTGRKP